jgi:hypothetical protein
MPTTTNYGWTTPADTDLVKDGASAIRTLGNGVDTTVKALNPETTLGDISYRSSTSNTNTRLAIGSNGQVLTVSGGVPTWAAVSAAPTSATATVATGQTTTSTSYTDLATAGPAVTITTGTKALILITSNIDNQQGNGQGHVGFAISGASSVSASDATALHYYSGGIIALQYGAGYLVTGLTAGSNTFTLKYKSGNGSTQFFANRQITVLDMGS